MSDSEVATLAKLGLTDCQAKVYLTLVRAGMSSALSISQKSNVARSDVYRILSLLQKKGIVEKKLTHPTKFEATPLREAVDILIQLRKKDLDQTQIEMRKFLKKFEKGMCPKNSDENPEDNQFRIIPAQKAFINRLKELAQNSTEIIETLMPTKRILQAIPFFENTIMDAHNRGVKTPLISENIGNEEFLMRMKRTYLDTKFFPERLSVGFCIYDRKNVVIVNSPHSSFPKCNGLWSNNPSIVELASAYFDDLWSKF